MQKMTDTLETKNYYWGSKIYRHTWKSNYYYHLEIPLSSCLYCNIYKYNGENVNWKTENMDDYLKNKQDEIIMCECSNNK